jgi:mannitol 2-dehydrogenase
MGRDLAAQDFLTTVVTQEAEHSRARVTGAMIDFVPPGDGGAILQRLVDPRTGIVSLTVTEGGYYVDPAGVVMSGWRPFGNVIIDDVWA